MPETATNATSVISSTATTSQVEIRACDGDLSSFIQKGFSLPVLLLAHRRAERLLETLRSLAGVRGFSTNEVLVSQDGSDEEAPPAWTTREAGHLLLAVLFP